MPIPLRLSFLPPLSSAGLSVDAVDITDRQYNFLFGDDQIPVIHLSASPATPNSLTTYKTSVSALTSFFPWDLTIINPGNLSPGGFNWTTTGDLSTYGGINILNTVGNGRNFFLSGVGVNTIPKLGEYSFTIVEKTTAGIILRSDETRGPQLVIGLDPENHGAYVQGGKFSGFRFPRPLIFRLATPAATEHMRLDANAFLGIGDSQFPPVKLTVRGSISAGRGFDNFTQTTSGGSISAVGNVVNFFGGPVCIGTNILQRFPGIDAGNINSIQALVVGGGGGGGGWGGGGGAGGVVAGTYSVTPGTNYAVTVGNGGTRGAGPTYTVGGDGGNSSIAGLATAVGGGGGGNWSAGNGRNGGSGGGGSGTGIGGTGTAGQGFNGGAGGSAGSTPYFGHGGGGGAGGVGGTRQGSNLTVGGNGGPGVLSNITGTSTYYGGGGGGHSPGNASGLDNTQVGLGGIGGGGNGGRYYSPGLAAQDGQPNTGGGGGGAYGDVGQLCGNGGTGVVVIRYVGPPRATGGDSVYSYNDGSTTYTVHVFSSVGTSNFTVFNTSIMENAPSLVVIGSISATGNLSATRLDTFNSVRGRLGIGTNTFNNNDLRLAVIGDVLTESGSLSVVDPARFVYLASKLGVGVNSYTDAANGLTIVGNISATGSLSATGDSFSSFYGNVGISIPATASSIQHYSQALTVRGSISSTGSLSAVNPSLDNFIEGNLAIGDRFNIGGGAFYSTGTGFDNIVLKNTYTRDAISVTVGSGGAGAPAGVGQPRGSNGSNSTFGPLVAIGGGGGASCHDRSTSPAGNGGSGGGASGGGTLPSGGSAGGGGYGGGIRGLGTPGQGFDGGTGVYAWFPGGGGGAGGPGTNTPGNGGPGVLNRILGRDYYWGGGGGGSGYTGSGGNGGIGGGGGGAILTTTGGIGFDSSGLVNGQPGGGGATGVQANTPGGNGGQNTGGGGGGGAHYSSNNFGGNGGSGILIVRYQGDQKADGGAVYSLVDGGITYTVHLFTSVGSSTFSKHLTSADFNLEYLLIAGGGGGGSDMGGGGGAGGVLAGTASYSSLVDGVYYGGNFTTYNAIAANRMVRLNSNASIDSNFAYGTGFNGHVYTFSQDSNNAIYVGGIFTTYQGNSNPGIIRLLDNGSKDTVFVNGVGITGGAATVSAIAIDNRNNIQVDVLVVGGGGGGGGWGGGGGAGGVIERTITIPRQTYFITVGGGGAPGTSFYTGGTRGGDSSAFGIGAVGGGGGGWYSQNDGRPGGSGGGGGGSETNTTLPLALGGSGIPGQGFDGGRGGGRLSTYFGGGGGGGAGGPGNDFSGEIGGNGGPGVLSNINGTPTYYGGGGGGHSPGQTFPPTNYALGGIGGGGDGGRYGNGSTGLRNATSGTANRGGGGGGSWGGSGSAIGSGGSGIVIVRYLGPQRAVGGTVSTVTVGASSYTVHTFTSTGISILDFSGIYLGGSFTAYKGTGANNIVKVNGIGTIDSTFSYGTGFNGNVHAIALDTVSDGIYVGGNFTTYNGISANRIIKLTSTGTRDTTFYAITGFNDIVRTIAVDLSGRVYVGGDFTTFDYNARNRIVRLLSGGQIDNTFNTVSALTGFNDSVKQITLRNNRVYVAGNFTSYKGETRNRYACIDLNGNTISPFASGTGFNNSVETFAFDNQERIYYAGNFTTYRGSSEPRVVRLLSDGFTSDSFNNNIPPAFQRLTVQGSISSTGSLSAISFTNTNNFNYLASKLGIGTNTFEGQNLQLAVIGSISGTGSVSATDLNAFNVFRGYTGIGTNARQRYDDRSFSWSTSNNIGATNAISTGLNSVYVAGRSSSPYFYFSNNSPNIWLSASEPAGTSSIKSIAFGGRFVALESGASLKTYYSNNGTAWVAGGSLPLSLEWGGVSFGNEIFLATSTNVTNRTAYSTNSGINWSLGGNLPTNGNWSKPVYNPAYNSWLTTRGVFWDFVAISNNNGITWSQIPVGFALDWTDAVFVPPNYYVLLGGSDNKIAYSSNNGVSFTVVNLPVSDQWNAIAAGSIRGINYVFITATNSNRVLYSSDLNNWFLLPQLPATKDWTNLTYNTSGVLAVASDGTSTIGNFFIDDYRHLNVVGTVSATGALSATHTTDFNFIGGQVIIGGKPPTVPIVNQNDRPAFNQKLTVLGNISATGTLSAADTDGRGVSFFGGRLGVGTNNTYDQRLTVLGNISSTGSLTAMDFAQGNDFNYIGGRLGVGPNANTSRAFNNYLTVIGNVSARGALSADSTDYNFIGGQVMIGGKPPTIPVINQNDRPAFNQKLTVVGNISSTGALSATNSSGVSIFGRLAVGTNSSYGQRLTVLGNISSTGALSAICAINNPLTDTTFNYFAGQVGIGTNQIPDSSIQLAVLGSVSATGSLSAMDMDRFNFIGGNLQVGPIVNSPLNAPASVQRLTVVGNISSTGALSATDLDGINVFGRHVHIGPVNFQNINLNHNLTVVGNISSTGALSAIGNINFNTFNYFAGQVGIGTNEITDPSVELSITGNLSAQGTLSAGNMLNFNYFGSPVGIGTNTFEGRDNLELTVIGNVSATGSLSAVGTDISYLSSRLVIAPVSLFGSTSSVNYSFNTGLTVFGAISSNESLSARSIYTDPLIFNYTAPTVGTQLEIPRGFNYIKIIGIGGGGGGGSGRRDTTTGTPKYGGGGGGGGDYVEMIIPLKKLSSQVIFVTAGLGGVGGAAQATSPANGNEGFNGAATAVAVGAATNPPIFIARGGRGGKGGTNFAETSLGGKSGGRDSGDGADPAVLTFSTATEYLSYTLASEAAENGGSGGGAGGSINANNNNTTGLIGFSALPGGSAGGNNQISRNGQTGTAGANGVSIAFSNTSENIWGGAGGGGGGASTTGAGGTGGAGALGGGGGGGGGASSSASSSGAGGNGGNGYLRILIY